MEYRYPSEVPEAARGGGRAQASMKALLKRRGNKVINADRVEILCMGELEVWIRVGPDCFELDR